MQHPSSLTSVGVGDGIIERAVPSIFHFCLWPLACTRLRNLKCRHHRRGQCVDNPPVRSVGASTIRSVKRGRGGCGPGGDLRFRRWSGSTIGAEGFHGRVRDGIGCWAPRYGHQAGNCLSPRERGGLSCDKRSVFGRPLGPGFHGRLLPRWRGDRGSCRYARRRFGDRAPVERLVPVSCAGRPASTSGLSTW